MGDPKKIRKKYSTPMHPWQRTRIEEEKEISKSYGTKNKKEIWKMYALVKKLATEAKLIVSLRGEEYELKKAVVLAKAKKLGLIKEGQEIDNILGLTLKDVMERRLQTLTFKKGLAMSVKQARQFITHEHIMVGGKKVTSPSYIVKIGEEDSISFSHDSPFNQMDNAEREKLETVKSGPKEEKKEKDKPAKSLKKELKLKDADIITADEIPDSLVVEEIKDVPNVETE
jgi:small subunit ribosomal protein S4